MRIIALLSPILEVRRATGAGSFIQEKEKLHTVYLLTLVCTGCSQGIYHVHSFISNKESLHFRGGKDPAMFVRKKSQTDKN